VKVRGSAVSFTNGHSQRRSLLRLPSCTDSSVSVPISRALSTPEYLDLKSYTAGISFRAIEPGVVLGPDRRLRIGRPGRADAKVLELPGARLDVINTVLPEGERETRRALAPTHEVPRMSTFAIAALLNRAVAAMPEDQVYVNVGVWHGFTYFAGALGNRDKRCFGVDNFSKWGKEKVRLAFENRLDRIGTRSQTMFTMDYQEYFAKVHREPIGVYLYDGDHAYEHQLRGLQIAEPFFADGCVIFVDDTNWPHPHGATLDFIAQSDRRWEILLDARTSSPGHPTWWNGLMVIRDVAGASPERKAPPEANLSAQEREMLRPPEFMSEPLTSDRPLVSLVLRNDGLDADRLRAAIEQALGQDWPNFELLVADEHPCRKCHVVLDSFGSRLKSVTTNDANALRTAIAESSGQFIAFADCDSALRPSAIEIGLAFPAASRFNTELTMDRHVRLEQSLAVDRI
jgi:Methyltransferase domain/Glycosyl transferase family 2